MYYLCEKYYKPIIVQYYIADCVSWVPWLILWDLRIGLTNALSECNSSICGGLTVYICITESLCSTPGTNTTFVNQLYFNKKRKREKRTWALKSDAGVQIPALLWDLE